MVNLAVDRDIIKGVRLVIFDKDGTLMDLYNYWANMVLCRVTLAQKKLKFREAEKKDIMYAMGVDIARAKLRPDGPVGLKKREIVMQAMIDALKRIGFADMNDLCFEAFKKADELSLKNLTEIIKPIKGMHELVTKLGERGCKIAIATTDNTERATLAVGFLGIADKVNIVVGEDMVKNYKPYPDMVDLILERLAVNRKNAVMVGDAITDVEMGENAGLLASIGVCSGLTPKEKLLENTRYVIEDISKIGVV